MPTILIRVRIRVRIQIFRIKRLNVKFSKYQKQSPGDVLLKTFFKIKLFH